ncbi:hypothetical protein GQ44DRAFT_723491 [Phaeosphaeriaceae sp. PMI808]|nr:hypothetical protein GQ44DRAFT_723491 [Phaeosphaeriaceae sp. PMI808]
MSLYNIASTITPSNLRLLRRIRQLNYGLRTNSAECQKFISPLITQEHAEAAAMCCSVFEQEVVTRLVGRHKRADPKLTSSERSRITNVFFLAWRIILATRFNGSSIVQERFKGLSPTDLLHVREVALFMCINFDNSQHHEIGRLMGYITNGDVGNTVREVLAVADGFFQEKGLPVHQPDYAPLGLGLLFDDW